MGSRRQNTDEPPSAHRHQPPKTEGFPGRSLFNARILHVSMAITTSKNQIFIIVRHPHVDLWKGGRFARTPHKSQPFLLAVEVPAEFKPRKSRARLLKQLVPVQRLSAALRGRSEFNHKQDLHIEKIVKMKGNRRTKGRGGPLHKCLVIISGCPIYLTLTIPSCHREEENMFSLPKQGNG